MNARVIDLESTEMRRALERALAETGQSPAELDRQVRTVFDYVRRLDLTLGGPSLLVRGDRSLCGSVCMLCPGRTALLLATDGRLAADLRAEVAHLARRALRAVDPAEGRLVQVLRHPEDAPGREAMIEAGFSELATLHYLERAVDSEPIGDPVNRPGDAWRAYDDGAYPLFVEAVRRSYEGTLDCRMLTGLRSVDDAIAGHRGAGLFQPRWWQVLLRDGQPIACILMVENPLRPVLEVAYMGVSPAARGQGIGTAVMQRGLAIAFREGFTGVSLAVDAANPPAQRLYRGLGFKQRAARLVMLRLPHSNPCRSGG